MKNYKQATGNIHGLLRKALRLDEILNTEDSESELSQNFPDPQCVRCHTEFSPRFYPTPPSTPDSGTSGSSSTGWLCHKCHFAAEMGESRMQGVAPTVNGLNGITA